MPKGRPALVSGRYATRILHVESAERPGVTYCGKQTHRCDLSEDPAADHSKKSLCAGCTSRMQVSVSRSIGVL